MNKINIILTNIEIMQKRKNIIEQIIAIYDQMVLNSLVFEVFDSNNANDLLLFKKYENEINNMNITCLLPLGQLFDVKPGLWFVIKLDNTIISIMRIELADTDWNTTSTQPKYPYVWNMCRNMLYKNYDIDAHIIKYILGHLKHNFPHYDRVYMFAYVPKLIGFLIDLGFKTTGKSYYSADTGDIFQMVYTQK